MPSRAAKTFLSRYVHAVGGAALALTVGPFTHAGRQKIKGIAAGVGHRDFHGRIPKVELETLFTGLEPIQIFDVSRTDWNVSLLELVAICRFGRRARPAAIFEFGTFDGRTTFHLAANVPDARITTLDLPPERGGKVHGYDPGGRFRDTPVAARITQAWGDSMSMDLAGFHGQFDMIFIDAGHAHENVINDSIKALPLLRGGKGLILWHDYENVPDVTPALDHLFATDERFTGLRHVRGTSLAFLEL